MSYLNTALKRKGIDRIVVSYRIVYRISYRISYPIAKGIDRIVGSYRIVEDDFATQLR